MAKGNRTFYTTVAVITVIVIFLLLQKKGYTVNPLGNSNAPIEIPGVTLPPRTEIIIPDLPGLPPIDVTFPPVTIPGYGGSTFYNYDMRSACGCGNNTVPVYLEPATSVTTTTVVPVTQPVPQSSMWMPYRG